MAEKMSSGKKKRAALKAQRERKRAAADATFIPRRKGA